MPGLEDFGGHLPLRKSRRLIGPALAEREYRAPIFGQHSLSHVSFLLMMEAATCLDMCEIQYRRMRTAIRRGMSKEAWKKAGMTRIGSILVARAEVAIFIGLVYRALEALEAAKLQRDVSLSMPPVLRSSGASIRRMRGHFEHAIDRARLRAKKGRKTVSGNPIFHSSFGLIENGTITFGADQVQLADFPRWIDWLRQAVLSYRHSGARKS